MTAYSDRVCVLTGGLRSAIRRSGAVGSAAARPLVQRDSGVATAEGQQAATGTAAHGATMAHGGGVGGGEASLHHRGANSQLVGSLELPEGHGCSSDAAIGCMARPAVVVMSHNRPGLLREPRSAGLRVRRLDGKTVRAHRIQLGLREGSMAMGIRSELEGQARLEGRMGAPRLLTHNAQR